MMWTDARIPICNKKYPKPNKYTRKGKPKCINNGIIIRDKKVETYETYIGEGDTTKSVNLIEKY